MPDPVLRRILLGSDEGQAPPLFSSLIEVARAVRRLDEGAYPNERALSSFLGQIINGGRTCPKPLAHLLIRAAVEAAPSSSRGAEVEAQLRAILFQTEGSEVDELLARQIGAELVVIVNPEPQEVRRHPRATDFQRAMCRSLHPQPGDTEGRYIFVLANNDMDAIQEHWDRTTDAFLLALREEGDATTDDARRMVAQLDQADKLMLVGVPPYACAIPTIAFDPHLRGGWCDVVVWDSFIEGGAPVDRIIKLSHELKSRWVRDYYKTFLLNDRNYTRYTYEHKYDA